MADYKVGDLSKLFPSGEKEGEQNNIFKKNVEVPQPVKKKKSKKKGAEDTEKEIKGKKEKLFGAALRAKKTKVGRISFLGA